MNIAIIIQRYQTGLAGGSELHCRIIAEMLSREHSVTILTTCARDYITWDNFYPAGESTQGKIRIIRFPAARSRDIDAFNRYSEELFLNKERSLEQEMRWIEEQGPLAPALADHIKEHVNSYDIALFYTYLYYPTVLGLEHADRSILIPTFHPEKPASLGIFKNTLPRAKGYIFNTREEMLDFRRYGFLSTDRYIIEGLPVDILIGLSRDSESRGLEDPGFDPEKTAYFLYSGRIDRQKGFYDILEYFRLMTRHGVLRTEKLIITGSGELEGEIDCSNAVFLGFVSDNLKYKLIKNALAVLVPSYMESLSIIALEAFYYGVPVIGRQSCAPVRGHIQKGRAGFLFSDFDSFRQSVVSLLSDRHYRKQMGENARIYVQNRYNSERIKKAYNSLFQSIAT